jgi:hypothetical protein
MAKVKEIYVEASFTKNLGNFQSFKPTAGATITIEDGDKVADVFAKGWELVGDEVSKQLSLFESEQKSLRKGL